MGVVAPTSKDNLEGFIALIIGIYIFKVTSYFSSVETLLQEHPTPIFIGLLIAFFYRKKIVMKIKGKKNGR